MKIFRHLMICGGILSLLWVSESGAELIASDRSDRYHRPSCRVVSRIDPGHRLRFATKGDAWRRGYRPCEVCRPEGFDLPAARRPPKGGR
ncbi:MAG: hypothetical protein Fur0034_19120 [Desulfuromonadia bacterium]